MTKQIYGRVPTKCDRCGYQIWQYPKDLEVIPVKKLQELIKKLQELIDELKKKEGWYELYRFKDKMEEDETCLTETELCCMFFVQELENLIKGGEKKE